MTRKHTPAPLKSERPQYTYLQWKARYGDSIARDGARYAALLAMVPDSYAERYTREAAARDRSARAQGGAHRFYIP